MKYCRPDAKRGKEVRENKKFVIKKNVKMKKNKEKKKFLSFADSYSFVSRLEVIIARYNRHVKRSLLATIWALIITSV